MPCFYETSFVKDILNSNSDGETQQKFSHEEIKGIREKYGDTFEAIEILAPSLKQVMKKPQRVEFSNDDLYLATDTYTDTVYICFRNLLMVDVDTKIDIDTVLSTFVSENPSYTFDVYSTLKGYHIFDVSREHSSKDKESMNLMLKLDSDFFYCVYSYIRGWSVRLNKKIGNGVIDSTSLYTFHKRFGSDSNVKDKLEGYVKMHFDLSEHYKFQRFSKMR